MSESLQVTSRWLPLFSSRKLRTLGDFLAYDSGERLDKPGLESWRQRWRLRLADGESVVRTFYLKRFERPPLRRQWDRWLAGNWSSSTASTEWNNALALASAGVRAVEPAAFGQQMCGPIELRSFVVLGEAPGESLERWVPTNLPAPSAERDWRMRRARLDALARFVAKFHAAGFVHRDLYLCHVFYDDAGCGVREAGCGMREEAGEFCLIDLQRVFRPWWRARRWVVKDLAALNFSTPAEQVSDWERLRFLCRYARECGRFGSARKLADCVAAKSERIGRRHSRLAGSSCYTDSK